MTGKFERVFDILKSSRWHFAIYLFFKSMSATPITHLISGANIIKRPFPDVRRHGLPDSIFVSVSEAVYEDTGTRVTELEESLVPTSTPVVRKFFTLPRLLQLSDSSRILKAGKKELGKNPNILHAMQSGDSCPSITRAYFHLSVAGLKASL